MQIKVTNISTNRTGVGKTNLSVHIGAIHINESACCMDRIANRFNFHLEDAMGRRIRDHAASQNVFIGFYFLIPIH